MRPDPISHFPFPLKLYPVFYYCREEAEALCMIENVAWTGEIQRTPTAEAAAIKLDYTVRPRR